MRKALLILFLLILTSLVSAQNVSEDLDNTTIFANSNEVSQDLVVRDHKNRCVLDLKPEDIAITDNGSTVKISSLHFVTEKSQVRRSISIVFGRLDSSAATNASEIANKILKAVPENDFTVSVLNISGRLRLFQEFTTDRAVLRKAVNLATGTAQLETAAEIAQPEKDLMSIAETGKNLIGAEVSEQERATARIMLMTLQESQRIVQDQHAQPSLAALLALARTQRHIPGRKAIVYFTQNLPDDVTNEEMMRSIIGAANRAGIILYVINANAQDLRATQGLIASGAVSAAVTAGATAPTLGNSRPPGLQPVENTIGSRIERLTMDGLAVRDDPMDMLSQNTGGVYVAPGEGLKRPLQQMIEDMTTYYEASYVPALNEYTGKFRPVTVKALRAGLDIRSRSGYFALPPGSDGDTRPFETPLLKFLAEPHPPSSLPFRSGIVRLGNLPDGNASALIVEVPLKELKVDEEAGKVCSVHVSIVAEIKDNTGATVEHFSEDLPRHDTKEVFDTATDSDVITMQRHFLAAPGDYTLEVVVQDRNNGKASVQHMNFEITKQPVGPALSDVSIVRRTDQFTWEADPLDPLRYENSKVIPNISGVIDRASQLVSFFFIVHPDATTPEHAKLEMAILKGGHAIAKLPLPMRRTTGAGALPYLASIRASSLQPGEYEVKETLTQDGKSTDSIVSFKIDAK